MRSVGTLQSQQSISCNRNHNVFAEACLGGQRVCEEGPGLCALLMTALSLFMILLSLPVSLILVVKVVQVEMFI